MTEQVCLRNSDFQDNTISAFGAFRHDQDFSDVTLACVDGEQSSQVHPSIFKPFLPELAA